MGVRWVETRQCRRLTWPARLLLLTVLALGLVFGLRHLHDFLAPNEPLGGDYLVVEGWTGDTALARAGALFRAGHYRRLLVTGAKPYRGTIEQPEISHAEIAARILRRVGIKDDEMALISQPEVKRARTYSSALAVRDWFRAAGVARPRFDLGSEATHSARSHLLYEMAFAGQAEIGIIALPRDDYDPQRWWASSAGVRMVITEFLGWLYVRVTGRP